MQKFALKTSILHKFRTEIRILSSLSEIISVWRTITTFRPADLF